MDLFKSAMNAPAPANLAKQMGLPLKQSQAYRPPRGPRALPQGSPPMNPLTAPSPTGLPPSGGSSQLPLPIKQSNSAPPKITMPRPKGHTMGLTSGSFANIGSNTLIGAGVGGVTGGLYNSEGPSLSGAAKGALGGAIFGAAIGVGAPALASSLSTGSSLGKMGSYGQSVTRGARAMNSTDGRRVAFATGGMLGGLAFTSGSSSKKRGFNQNRGNSFSR